MLLIKTHHTAHSMTHTNRGISFDLMIIVHGLYRMAPIAFLRLTCIHIYHPERSKSCSINCLNIWKHSIDRRRWCDFYEHEQITYYPMQSESGFFVWIHRSLKWKVLRRIVLVHKIKNWSVTVILDEIDCSMQISSPTFDLRKIQFHLNKYCFVSDFFSFFHLKYTQI